MHHPLFSLFAYVANKCFVVDLLVDNNIIFKLLFRCKLAIP